MAPTDEANWQQARHTRIMGSVAELSSRLSISGFQNVAAKFQDAKPHIKLFPIPNMNPRVGLLRRLFSLPIVHAQIMSPYGVAFANMSVDDTTETFYGTSVTNGDSGCNCHNSTVNAWMYGPAGEMVASPYDDAETEYAEVDQSWTWDDGTIGTVLIEANNVAYCPFAGYNFIDGGTSASGLSFSPIQHRYPSNPLPQPCRITSWFDAVRSAHAHHAEDLIFDNGKGGGTVPAYDTPVYAMEAGKVDTAIGTNGPASAPYPDCQGAAGNYVKIKGTDNYFTIYFHVTPAVSTGDPIVAGQLIGWLDNSGCQTAAHLHVGRRDPSGTPVNFTIPCVNPLPAFTYDDGTVEDGVPDDI